MAYQCSELVSVPGTSDTLTPFSDSNRRKRIPPPPVLTESIPETSRERFPLASEKGTKALRWALDRVACWELPGKDYLVEYLRDMYRRNCKPSTFQGALFAIYLFLTGLNLEKPLRPRSAKMTWNILSNKNRTGE